MLLLLSGCHQADKNEDAGRIELPYTRTMERYGIKGAVTLTKRPERVASLSYTPVMALYELGVRQVAVPANRISQWPEELQKTARQMNTAMSSNLDIESIVSLQPDLVLMPYLARDKYGKLLENQKIPVYYVDAGPAMSYQSMKELTQVLVDAFGRKGPAGEQIMGRFAALEKRVAEQKEKNKGKKVMILLSTPPQHYIQGEEANLGSMMKMLGYENVFQEKNIKNSMALLDKEKALSYVPDVILTVGMGTGEQHRENMEKDFAKNPDYWQKFRAVREGRILYLPSRYAISSGIGVTEDINLLIDMLEKNESAHPRQ